MLCNGMVVLWTLGIPAVQWHDGLMDVGNTCCVTPIEQGTVQWH